MAVKALRALLASGGLVIWEGRRRCFARALLASLLAHGVLLFGGEWSCRSSGLQATPPTSLNVQLAQRHVVIEAPTELADRKGAKFAKVYAPKPRQVHGPAFPPAQNRESSSEEAVDDRDVAPAALSAYRLTIARQARRYRIYPADARERGVAGEVGVSVLAARAGVPIQVRIEQSSGDALLDEAALSMITRAAQDAPLPAELRGRRWRISVPLLFSLDG